MIPRIAITVAVAGFALSARAVVNTSVVMQVSLDGVTWSNRLDDLMPDARVIVRTLVSYTGTAAPLGMGSMVFQPTVSGAQVGDQILPFINGGMGGNTTGGVLTGGQLFDTVSFGRVSPWGRTGESSTSAIRGFFHTNPNGDGVNYLRIARAYNTNWIGRAGNTTGGGGVICAQLSDVGRSTSDPAFNNSLTNIYVFKFGIQLGNAPVTRNMVIDAPLAGFGNLDTLTGERTVHWFSTLQEPIGSIWGTAVVTPAMITVVIPSPATLWLVALGGGTALRRRRV